jgi:hypothetical protein
MQTREVHAGEGYGITNSFTQHFGLGEAAMADSLVVIWPCGNREVFYDVEANRDYYLEEDGCLTYLLDLDSGPFVQCGADIFTIKAPEGYTEYLWSDGSTGSEIMTFEPGVYHVSLTDDQGCTWIAGPVIVSPVNDVEPSSIEITVDGRPNLCAGDEIVLSVPRDALSWLWNTGDTTSFLMPAVSGEYSVQATYVCNTLTSDTIGIRFADPNELTIVNDTLLGGGSGLLEADGDSILWFSDPFALDSLGSGPVLVTPDIDTTTLFYAQQTLTIPGEQHTIGPTEHAGTLYNSNQANGAIRFDVFSRFRIDSVLVMTTWPGERTILIIDVNEDTVYSQTFAIDSGRYYLPLDVWVEPGLDYLMTTDRNTNQATFGVNSPRLFRSDRSFLYPYTIHDVLSITGTQSSQQFYYYFYDWHLTREDQYCIGDLIPAQVVVVDTTSSAVFTSRIEAIELRPNPAGDFVIIDNIQLLTHAGEISMYDARGLKTGGWQLDRSSGRLLIDKLAAGMYFVRVSSGEKTYLGQFVKM